MAPSTVLTAKQVRVDFAGSCSSGRLTALDRPTHSYQDLGGSRWMVDSLMCRRLLTEHSLDKRGNLSLRSSSYKRHFINRRPQVLYLSE